MRYEIERLSAAEYAHVRSRLGEKIYGVGPVYWIQARPFFYRPLLTYASIRPDQVTAPCRFGGYQYVTDDNESANSSINFRVFEGCESYSLATAKREYRRMVRVGMKHFEVRPIRIADELSEGGYQLYMSFYGRTRYRYKSNRISRDVFDKWVDALFGCPKTILIGAYADGILHSLSICYWVDDLLLYNSSISDTESLRLHVSDLMLHVVRELVANRDGIRKIVAGYYSGGVGYERFDLLRGAKIERRPARYVTCPPLMDACLKVLSPEKYRKLTGTFG